MFFLAKKTPTLLVYHYITCFTSISPLQSPLQSHLGCGFFVKSTRISNPMGVNIWCIYMLSDVFPNSSHIHLQLRLCLGFRFKCRFFVHLSAILFLPCKCGLRNRNPLFGRSSNFIHRKNHLPRLQFFIPPLCVINQMRSSV